MKLIIEKSNLDQNSVNQLIEFKDVGTFVNEVVKKPTSTTIHWIKVGDVPVGYCVVKEFNGSEIFNKFIEIDVDDPEQQEELEDFLDFKERYYYIEYLEIFQPFQQKGFGKEFVRWLKTQYDDQRIILYCLFETREFWESYIVDEFDHYWLLIS